LRILDIGFYRADSRCRMLVGGSTEQGGVMREWEKDQSNVASGVADHVVMRGHDSTARRKVLLSMVFSLALVVSAVASLNIALPAIAEATGATQTQLQWIVDAYAIVFAGLLLPAGAIGDRYGRRRVLVGGLVVFGAAYGAATVATEPVVLIACRAVAGIGAAFIMPATLSIITTVFPPEERARAVGTWAGVAGGGAVIGLLLSGSLLETASWRWVFAANAIWALGAIVLAGAWAPESSDRDATAIDPFGAVLSAGGLSAVVYATIEGPHRGWSDAFVVAGYGIGAAALIGFVAWELSRARPLLDPRLFRHRGFANGSLSITLQFLALFGFFFVGMQYLQLVLAYSPLQAAFALLPMAMTFGGFSRLVAPRLVEHLGAGRVNGAGLIVAAGGFCVLATLQVTSDYWHLLAGLLVLGAGMGLATTPATTEIVATLPPSKQGVASAVNDAAREVGGAVGIALLGSLLTSGYQAGIDPHLTALPPGVAAQAHDSLAFVVHAAARMGPPGERLLEVGQRSFVDGMHTAMWVGAAVLGSGGIIALARRRRDPGPTDGAPSGDAGRRHLEEAR
jgi:EmrB/QacA subfamily drug resistance transporter